MLHPLLHLIATQPQLLAGHAEAYAELVAAEFGTASAAWKRRAVFHAVALCCLVGASVLAGVALMLWAVVPAAQAQVPWMLAAVPLLPLTVAAICLAAARASAKSTTSFGALRQQVQADLLMLREVSR